MNEIIKKQKLLKKKLLNDELSIGGWMQISNTSIAEIFGNSNFDWVVIDKEHGTFDNKDLISIFCALEKGNTLPFVRVSSHDSQEVISSLEIGARGIIVPKVESAENFQNLINKILLQPNGQRGIGYSRSNSYGLNFTKHLSNADPIIVAMIESKIGLENIESICQLPHLDGVFIGPYDLSSSLGCIGDFENMKFKNSIKQILKTSKKYKKACGIHVIEPSKKDMMNKITNGFNFIAFSLDTVILRKSIEI